MQVLISAGAYTASLLTAIGIGIVTGALLVGYVSFRHRRKAK